MATDYSTMDRTIMAAVQTHNSPYTCHFCTTEAAIIAKVTAMDPHDAFRVIDRRLQALRKTGKIAADRKAPGGGRLA